jgi:autotransporter-associated beta strand protein
MGGVGALQISGGEMNFTYDGGGTGYPNSITSFVMTGGTLNIASPSSLVASDDFDLQAGTVNGILGGDVGLLKSTDGAVTLSVSPVYTGNTIVNGGTLTINGDLNTPAATVSVASGAVLNVSSITADTLIVGGGPFAAASVPEPGTLVLLTLAGLGILFAAWRKK